MRIHPVLIVLAACSSDAKLSSTPTDAPSLDAVGDADTDADADSDADSDADTDTDADGAPTDTADTGASCENAVVERFPADGEADVYVGSEVFFTLLDADPTASITVTDAGGVVVPGASTVYGNLVRWSGGPLAPTTPYAATLTHACGTEQTLFLTSDVGSAPLAVDPTGFVYAIDLGSGAWAEPVGLGAVLSALLASQQMLLSPTALDASTADFRGGIGEGGLQDMCAPTVEMPQTAFADPTFALVAPLVQLDFGGVYVDATDIDVEGAFASDGGRIQFGRFDAVIDTRYLGPAIGLSTAYDEVCNLVYALGIVCDLCADGLPYCLSISVDDLEAPYVAGTLAPRAAGDIAADPSCP